MAALGLIFSGCGDSTVQPEPPRERASSGRDYSKPENLVVDLAAAFENRDIDVFSGLLHPDYTAGQLGRADDIAGTAALFSSESVVAIRADVVVTPSIPATQIGLEDTRRIRVNNVTFVVTFADPDSLALIVHRVQDLYFKQDPQDATQWLLFSWLEGRVHWPGCGGDYGPTWKSARTMFLER